ncbi:MAG: hypothetical protein SFW09_10945 [Hyphomicrobiaceae bacterium]|nr:hypothetical protein [Hyphomicrobiaceae bacterium]
MAGMMQMVRLSDQILRDFATGKLQPEAHKVIADTARWDIELRTRIAELQRCRQASGAEEVVGERECRADDVGRTVVKRSTAIATALVALVVGVLGGHFFHGGPSAELHDASRPLGLVAGAITPRSGLHFALESKPDGARSAFGDEEGYVKPLTTFRAADGRYCREFDIAFTSGALFTGAACRGPQQRWVIEALVPGEHAAGRADSYVPASGRGSKLMAQVIEEIRTEPALDANAVRSLIQSRWQKG